MGHGRSFETRAVDARVEARAAVHVGEVVCSLLERCDGDVAQRHAECEAGVEIAAAGEELAVPWPVHDAPAGHAESGGGDKSDLDEVYKHEQRW